MSEENNQNVPMTNPAAAKRRAIGKKVAIISMMVAGAVGIVILLLALFSPNSANRYDSGVVIRIDHTPNAAQFSLLTQPGGEPAKDDTLVGTPLGNTYLSNAKEVREYYDGLTAEKGWDGGLYGSNNYVTEKEGSKALFYTFYLANPTAEAQPFRIQAKLNQTMDSLQEGSGARAYEYLRLALFVGNNGSPDDTVKYYGLENSDRIPTALANDDFRECIFGALKLLDDTDGHPYRVPEGVWKDGDIEYVDAFELGWDRTGLFDFGGQSIPANGIKRVTFAAFLDGKDPDSFGTPSEGQSLSFSLHIGV